ncbi:unannotated protein [freshwater metagenome]|uniref:Unannotated protein n=1 Tax=freshwater metagenome TaxID=449393 RepID=A0A6J6GFE0_9ZZZZ
MPFPRGTIAPPIVGAAMLSISSLRVFLLFIFLRFLPFCFPNAPAVPPRCGGRPPPRCGPPVVGAPVVGAPAPVAPPGRKGAPPCGRALPPACGGRDPAGRAAKPGRTEPGRGPDIPGRGPPPCGRSPCGR